MRSAARKSRTIVGPPPMRTSRSPAASRARSSASCGLASTKWNTVPPSISIDGRGWCVSTNTGVWNGGFGPHQPRHSSSVPTSVHGPVCAAELAPAHDLGADAEAVALGERVVDTRAATGLADHRAPEPGGEHPLVQAFPGVPERGVERDAVAGSEPVEGDREVVDTDLGHGCLLQH